jgi:3'(2'), 5'-bisphosphate nucleotidase
MVTAELRSAVVALARKAGQATMLYYDGTLDSQIREKENRTPVTLADEVAHDILVDGLRQIDPGTPVISEEAEAASFDNRRDWERFWLVDPLDGTKEFIRGGDDYTVNIGLIERGIPRLGVVFAPATGRLHGGCVGEGAWLDEGSGRVAIATRPRGELTTAVASKSHLNQATVDYLEAAVGNCGYVSIGSSLKFCILAEGKADIYPRAAPTSEWDTAAGHAVLLAAGGLVDGPDGEALRYGKRAFLNRAFVATSGWKPPLLEPFLEPFSGGGDLPQGV